MEELLFVLMQPLLEGLFYASLELIAWLSSRGAAVLSRLADRGFCLAAASAATILKLVEFWWANRSSTAYRPAVPAAVAVVAPMRLASTARCPVCAEGMSGGAIRCRRCQTPHHADCWQYNHGCAIFGCGR